MFAHTFTFLLTVGAVLSGVVNVPEVDSKVAVIMNTTSAPGNSTSTPVTTTAKPANATSAPTNTTSAPSSTTAKPANATSAPSNATTTTTAKPVNATSAPSNATTTTTAKPVNATSAPSNATTTAKPANVTFATTTPKPSNTTTIKPNSTITTTEVSKTGSFPHFQDVDPNTLSCDPKGQVFLLLPSFTDCSKFYMCAHGEEVEFNCAPGTVFDFVIQTCNHPWATKCILRTPKEDCETEGSGFGHEPEAYGMFGEEIENGPIDFLTADSTGTMRPIAGNAGKLYKGPINCQRADSASRQVAYKGDCQRYWHCVGPVPQISYCRDGLHFNDLTQQCDYEANVKCLVQDDEELKGEFILYN